ncbi:PREDICTED: hsp70-Hsp90 organizing protein 2-like [Camelina sativa]|uniref:Hsp70-Hsp90 organizing protein 2-like n=1 Tax=Camelina sativa TaxID=90675 RepID=A0ABM0WQ67_CAMSA|nr:PREDICTED: hsp70-Hsp90 organizing protein 2-like [Camelina sativa]
MADEAKAKGNAAYASGDFDSAVNHFTEAINLTLTNHILFSNRSAAHASLHHYNEALSDAKKTVELKPDWGKGYSRIGASHLGLHQFDEAVEAYSKGLEIDPSNQGLKSGLADASRSRKIEKKRKPETEFGEEKDKKQKKAQSQEELGRVKVSGSDENVVKSKTCFVCDGEDDWVLVCYREECSIAVHQSCASDEPDFDEFGNFYCPYCWYKRVVSKYVELKEKLMVK